jgi:rubrerythrin
LGYDVVYNVKGGIKAWQGLKALGPQELNLDLVRGDEDEAEIVLLAFGMEKGLQGYYREMGEKKDDSELKKLFADLVGIEEKHKQMLLELRADIGSGTKSMKELEAEVDSGVLEGGFDMEGLLEQNESLLNSARDVIELAMMLETQGLDLYMRFAEKSENEKTKAILFKIADEEKAHLAALGRLLEEKL